MEPREQSDVQRRSGDRYSVSVAQRRALLTAALGFWQLPQEPPRWARLLGARADSTRFRSEDIEMPPTAVTFAPAEEDESVVDEYSEKLLNLHHWFFELDCKTWRAISVRKRQLKKGEYLIRAHGRKLTPALTDSI
jgi:hypothetical protein